ncbi:acyltransferase family-domain-containing protein [Obelidium mucronatum]|nr:acyltransferase family-domain-containing protein [Obelidium mucronatum]
MEFQSSIKRVNLTPLGGVKGLSAFIIVMGHFTTNFAPRNETDYGLFAVEYFSAVTLFFLISGFTLSIFYRTAHQRVEFWIKRMARLAPMYWLSLLFCIPSFIAYGQEKMSSFYMSAVFTPLFIQSLTMIGNDFSGPLWQVSAFALCYLIYPFFIERFARMTESGDGGGGGGVKVSRKFLLVALALYLYPLAAFSLFWFKSLPVGVVHASVLARAPHFFLGVLLGLCFDNNDTTTAASSQTTMPKYYRAVFITEACSFVLLALSILCPVVTKVVGIKFWFSFMLWSEFLIAPIQAVWIYHLVQAADSASRDVSYAVYCLHYPLLYLYSWVRDSKVSEMVARDRGVSMGGGGTTVKGLFVLEFWDFGPAFLVILVVSGFSFYFVETPMRKWIIKRFLRKVAARQPVAAAVEPQGAVVEAEPGMVEVDLNATYGSSGTNKSGFSVKVRKFSSNQPPTMLQPQLLNGQIPIEIIQEIFSRIPLAEVFKFTRLCKVAYKCIRQSDFARLSLVRQVLPLNTVNSRIKSVKLTHWDKLWFLWPQECQYLYTKLFLVTVDEIRWTAAAVNGVDSSLSELPTIPRSIQMLHLLTSLCLTKGMIQGPLPRELWTVASLETLDLSFNNLARCCIPSVIRGLKNLVRLDFIAKICPGNRT